VLLNTYVKPRHRIIEIEEEPFDEDDWYWREYGARLTAFGINRITNEMVATAPMWAEVWDHVRHLIRDRHVVVYNSAFDYSMLQGNCEVNGLEFDIPYAFTDEDGKSIYMWHCAMHAYAAYYGEEYYNRRYRTRDYKWQRLWSACADMGVHVETRAHTAVGDCLRTVGLVQALAAVQIEKATNEPTKNSPT
jgi:DNA polymerase III subunit epsilon